MRKYTYDVIWQKTYCELGGVVFLLLVHVRSTHLHDLAHALVLLRGEAALQDAVGLEVGGAAGLLCSLLVEPGDGPFDFDELGLFHQETNHALTLVLDFPRL